MLIQFRHKPIKNLCDFTDAQRRSKVEDVGENGGAAACIGVILNGAGFQAE